jgi:hypothetical protein
MQGVVLPGYRIAWLEPERKYPNPWFPTHVQIKADDGTVRVGWLCRADDRSEQDRNGATTRFSAQCSAFVSVRR